jgi:hypothetical protein
MEVGNIDTLEEYEQYKKALLDSAGSDPTA